MQTAGGERYTRDGNLQINSTGQLVTNSGESVLGTSGPIVFQPTDHDIDDLADGTVTVQEGASHTDSIRGKLRVVSFTDAQKLIKQGNNLYSAPNGAAAQPDTKSTVQQGFVEKSNVNSVVEMSRMIEINAHLHQHRQHAGRRAKRPAQDRRSTSSPTFRPERD